MTHFRTIPALSLSAAALLGPGGLRSQTRKQKGADPEYLSDAGEALKIDATIQPAIFTAAYRDVKAVENTQCDSVTCAYLERWTKALAAMTPEGSVIL